jgi:CPA2 family monovalent cation:H+ antiporter-2
VVELNVETYTALQKQGLPAVYGNATQAEVLQQAGVATAASLILSASGASENTEAIRIAREMNPGIHIVARADFLGDAETLRKAGR